MDTTLTPVGELQDVQLYENLIIVQPGQVSSEKHGIEIYGRYDDFESLRTRINSETWVLPRLDGELKDILDMEKDFRTLYSRSLFLTL